MIIAYYLVKTPMATGDGGLGFELALAALGTLLGVAAGMIFRVFRGADEIPRSQAGIGYAALWIVVVGARIGFSYATSNSHRLQVWLFTHHIIADAITVAPIFRAAGMLVLRAAVLRLRAARLHGAVPRRRLRRDLPAGPTSRPGRPGPPTSRSSRMTPTSPAAESG